MAEPSAAGATRVIQSPGEPPHPAGTDQRGLSPVWAGSCGKPNGLAGTQTVILPFHGSNRAGRSSMSPTEEPDRPDRMVVECQECDFEETVLVDGDSLPADVLRKHARDTGHQLSVSVSADD